MVTNYLQGLVDSSGDQSKSRGDVIIGGINYGKKWSDKDAAMLNLQTAAAQQQLQLDLIADERAYNSPAAQSSRYWQAGMNPDLQNVDSGNTSIGSPVTAPTASGSPQTNFVRDILPQIPALLNSALGIYQQIQGVRSVNLDLKAKERSLNQSQLPLFDDIAHKWLSDYNNVMDRRSKGENVDMPLPSDYASLAVPHYYSNRDNKQFVKSFNQYFSTNYKKIYKGYRDFLSSDADSKINYGRSAGYVSHVGTSDNEIDNGLSALLGPLVDEMYKNEKSNYEHGTKQNQYRSSIMEAEKNAATAEDASSKPTQDFVNSLSKSYEDGNMFSGVLLMLFDLLKSGSVGNVANQAQQVKKTFK